MIRGRRPQSTKRLEIAEIIIRKRDGQALTGEEIDFFVRGCVDGGIPDYQLTALLMALFLRGVTRRELRDLTLAMARSGEVYDLGSVPGRKIDKHSTGGVGDKVSLILAPMVAACGAAVPMVAGRGLGHTGGTLDKLESIPGFRVRLTQRQFVRQLGKIGVVIAGQSPTLTPADRKLYALRDVTGTVESIPLIAASILSKKVASGIDGLVMDVKCGSGAFMPSMGKARALAEALVALGRSTGLRVTAYLTDMSQPLGRAVGNAIEVRECVEALRGKGPEDLMEVAYELGARMLLMGRGRGEAGDAREELARGIRCGAAFERFLAMVDAQGGDPRKVEKPERLPIAPLRATVRAERAGWLARIDARAVGLAVSRLGAGRRRAEDWVDHGVGARILKKIGDRVKAGETIWEIYARSRAAADESAGALSRATSVREGKVARPRLIKGFLH